MDFIESYRIENELEEWAEKIEREYARYGVNVSLKKGGWKEGKFAFQIKLKKATRVQQVEDKAKEVQFRLKLPVFRLERRGFELYLIISKNSMQYESLPAILSNSECKERSRKMELPYVVGHNVWGGKFIVDLSEQPHMLLGGSSNSGKSVALRSLITCLIYLKSPAKINLILIDVGANGLLPFDGVPHLSCPVVKNRETAYQVLQDLKLELERRIELQARDEKLYNQLPRLVLVIDEFSAFFSGYDNQKVIKSFVGILSNLLQRGRHGKIHVILAAQNPTAQNMKVDLGNITTRVAFKCAKRNFSETILGEAGAENLSGRGELLFKSSQYDIPQRIQGICLESKELKKMIFESVLRWGKFSKFNLKFTFNEDKWQNAMTKDINNISGISNLNQEEVLLSKAVLWVISQKKISCNLIMKKFGIGWNRANELMDDLNKLGVVESLDAKLPRRVVADTMDEISEEVLELLMQNGVSREKVEEAVNSKNF